MTVQSSRDSSAPDDGGVAACCGTCMYFVREPGARALPPFVGRGSCLVRLDFPPIAACKVCPLHKIPGEHAPEQCRLCRYGKGEDGIVKRCARFEAEGVHPASASFSAILYSLAGVMPCHEFAGRMFADAEPATPTVPERVEEP